MTKITPEILQEKITTLNEYYYPSYRCSLFLLPDGRMFGSDILYDHKDMLETILKRKIDNEDDVTDIITKGNVSRLVTNNKLLAIYLADYPTNAQRKLIKELVDSEHYGHFNFDCVILNEDRDALHKLRFALRLYAHM